MSNASDPLIINIKSISTVEGTTLEILLVLLVVYIAIFYFLKTRPEKQRKKEKEAIATGRK